MGIDPKVEAQMVAAKYGVKPTFRTYSGVLNQQYAKVVEHHPCHPEQLPGLLLLANPLLGQKGHDEDC